VFYYYEWDYFYTICYRTSNVVLLNNKIAYSGYTIFFKFTNTTIFILQHTPHILFICSWYPHIDNPTNGIFIKRHAECVALTNKVTVVFVKSSALVSKETITITETGNLTEVILLYPKISSTIPVVKEFKKLNTYSKYLLKCVEIAQQKQTIDIIHLNAIFPACIPTLQLIKILKRPLFITEHWTGYSPEDGSYQGFIMKYYTKHIVSKAHTIITVSDYLTRMMKNHHLPGNYQVVPNVIDTDLFSPSNSNEQEATQFIHISSLDEAQKNVAGIISAFAAALKTNVNLHLSIVGEAPNKANLQALTKQLGINSNVTFLGCLMGNDLVQAINKHDALVMFSNYETFCLVIPECFACGKPVITSNAGGIVDYMKPELGIVVDPKNGIHLTESFLTFAQTKQHYNPALIREFAVTHFSKQVINQKLTTLYQLALA